jgi:hypothetical protein
MGNCDVHVEALDKEYQGQACSKDVDYSQISGEQFAISSQ